jgi:hypothetical protein
MIQNTPNLHYVNESRNVLQQEVKEESLVSGVQERLKWLQLHIRKQVEGKKQKDLKRWGKEKWMTRKEYESKKK